MTTINEWAARWGVSAEAIADLHDALGMGVNTSRGAAGTEQGVQDRVRLAAAKQGWALWRNNVGVAMTKEGRPVRFGLANDSAKLNAAMKSADLIGIRPIQITQDMVGLTFGQFVSFEVKRPGWQFTNTPRERSQQHWAEVVTSLGGYAKFITDEEQLWCYK